MERKKNRPGSVCSPLYRERFKFDVVWLEKGPIQKKKGQGEKDSADVAAAHGWIEANVAAAATASSPQAKLMRTELLGTNGQSWLAVFALQLPPLPTQATVICCTAACFTVAFFFFACVFFFFFPIRRCCWLQHGQESVDVCDNGSFETFLPDKLEDLTSATPEEQKPLHL